MACGHAFVACAIVLLCGGAIAEERTREVPAQSPTPADGRLEGATGSARGQAWARSRRATNVIGAQVFGGPGHERVGQIEDLVIGSDGSIAVAVLNLNPNVLSTPPANPPAADRRAAAAVAGASGTPPADRLHAVPWSALRFDDTMQHFMLEVEVERLASSPFFVRGSWPDMTDADWLRRMERHYGRSYARGREAPRRR